MRKYIILALMFISFNLYSSNIGKEEYEIMKEYKKYNVERHSPNSLIVKYPKKDNIEYILFIFVNDIVAIEAIYYKNGTYKFNNN